VVEAGIRGRGTVTPPGKRAGIQARLTTRAFEDEDEHEHEHEQEEEREQRRST